VACPTLVGLEAKAPLSLLYKEALVSIPSMLLNTMQSIICFRSLSSLSPSALYNIFYYIFNSYNHCIFFCFIVAYDLKFNLSPLFC
jgi:hypothetical protein